MAPSPTAAPDLDTRSGEMMRKVGLLLKKAEGTDNEHEASAFYAKAQELIVEHSLNEQAIRESLGKSEIRTRPISVDWMMATYAHHAKPKGRLLHAIARANGVYVLLYPNRKGFNNFRPGNVGNESQWVNLVGFENDIETVKFLFNSLLVQAARFGLEDWRNYSNGLGGGRKFAFLSGHLDGFAMRIGTRLAEANAKVVTTDNSKALVVRRDGEVDDLFASIRKGTARASRSTDMMGQIFGRTAADRADLNQTRLPARRKALATGRN